MTASKQTVREIAQAHPSSTRVFEQFGIEYCCGGGKPLAEACAEKEVNVDTVLAALEAASHNENAQTKDWSKQSLAELTEHIIRTHHAFCKDELPRLSGLAARVVNAHGGTNPELAVIQAKWTQLADHLIDHLAEEEVVVFPRIVNLEAKKANGDTQSTGSATSMDKLLALLIDEHSQAGTLLAQIRSLSRNFVTPEYACTAYHAFYNGLREFERDLHRHVHLENNILFPRAVELELAKSRA